MLLPSVTNERVTVDESTTRSRHSDSIGQAFLWVLLPTLVLFLIAPTVGNAQVPVVTNITSSGLGTDVQPPSGGVYNITGGTRPGMNGLNLFHSFGDFTVGAGDTANFLNNTGLETSNIIGRVTELGVEHTSYIYGTIRTTDFGAANLFLVNPSGIVFGPQGSFDVGGSVSMSTADYLRFEGTATLFEMLSTPASLGPLDVAPVVAFGFTSLEPPAPITLRGSMLQVPEGQSLSLVGGDITLQAGTLEDGTMQAANLLAPGGTIGLASAASPGEFDTTSLGSLPNADGTSFTSSGSVSLAPGSSINVSGPRTVFIQGGQLVLSVNEATLSTSEAPAPPDTIALGPGSSILTANVGTEAGANVQLTGGTVRMDGSNITTVTSGLGAGGALQLQADSLTMENGASIVTATVDGDGVGGDVVLNVGTVSLMGGSSIQSQSQTDYP